MSQKSEFVKRINAKIYADGIMRTICGFKLASPKTRRVSLFKFDLPTNELKTLLSLTKEINKESKEYFGIEKAHVYLHDKAESVLQKILRDELLFVIAPQDPVNSLSKDILSCSPISREFIYGGKTYEMIAKRLVSCDTYAPATLEFLYEIIGVLASMPIAATSQNLLLAHLFRKLVNDNRRAYKRVISLTVNGFFKARADVSDLPWKYTDIEIIKSFAIIPQLLKRRKNTITISPAFAENKLLALPYIIAFTEFDFLPKVVYDKLIYSSMEYVKTI